jgi:hypothetical protein
MKRWEAFVIYLIEGSLGFVLIYLAFQGLLIAVAIGLVPLLFFAGTEIWLVIRRRVNHNE